MNSRKIRKLYFKKTNKIEIIPRTKPKSMPENRNVPNFVCRSFLVLLLVLYVKKKKRKGKKKRSLSLTFVIGQTLHGAVPSYPGDRQIVVQVGVVGRGIDLDILAGDGDRGPRAGVLGDAEILADLRHEIGVDPTRRVGGRGLVPIRDLLGDRLALLAPT